jgi:hypothetical protein
VKRALDSEQYFCGILAVSSSSNCSMDIWAGSHGMPLSPHLTSIGMDFLQGMVACFAVHENSRKFLAPYQVHLRMDSSSS